MNGKIPVIIACSVVGLLLSIFPIAGAEPSIISVGLAPIQNESGVDLSAETHEKLIQDLHQKIALTYEDLLPHRIQESEEAVSSMDVSQLKEFCENKGWKFIAKPGLLTMLEENDSLTIKGYVETISCATGEVFQTRVESSASEIVDSGEISTATDLIDKFAGAIYEIIQGSTQQHIAEAEASKDQTSSKDSADPILQDEELQQVMAQAEEVLNSDLPAESLNNISDALTGLQQAVDSKATLMEQLQPTADIDQEIYTWKEQLQTAIATAVEQTAATQEEPGTDQMESKNQDLLMSVTSILQQTLQLLTHIQEVHASTVAQAEVPVQSESEYGDEEFWQEETGEEIYGTVTDNGEPVEGATLTEPETGVSATTDSNGTFQLPLLPADKIYKILLAAKGKPPTSYFLHLKHGKPLIADLKMASVHSRSFVTVLPSMTKVKKIVSASLKPGTVKGTVKDANGQVAPRTLVLLKGFAAVRTDSKGNYAFMNVPPGKHQLLVLRPGFKPISQQIVVSMKQTSQIAAQLKKETTTKNPGSRRSPVIAGSGTTVGGLVSDIQKTKLAGVKILFYSTRSAASVFSNTKGQFQIRELKPGKYRVMASKLGYETAVQNVSISPKEKLQLTFQLKQQTPPWVAKLLKQTPPPLKRSRSISKRSIHIMAGGMTGRVIGRTSKRPISGVTVYLNDKTSMTNSSGSFEFKNMPPGKYILRARKSGYAEWKQTVRVESGKINILNINL